MTDLITTPVCLTYTAEEAAVILGVSHQTVGRMVRRGDLPQVDFGSSRVIRIPRWAIDERVAPPVASAPGVPAAPGVPPAPGAAPS